MIRLQKIRYFTFLVVALSLVAFYLLDRAKLKEKVNQYESDILSIEEQLSNNKLIMDEINNARNDYTDIIGIINSHNLSGSQLMNEINRIKLLANATNISIYNLEIDPKNTFPKNYQELLKEDINLERQTLSYNLKGSFIEIGKFLENLENSDSPIKLQSCSIVLDSLDPRGVIAQLRFATYTGIKS